MSGVRTCRVCGCTDDRACVTADGPCHWVEDSLCSACVASLDHVVSMTIDWHKPPTRVATCQCGWMHREPWDSPTRGATAQAMDAAVREHWQAAVAEAGR
jgi:hypothetical protein